MQKLLNAPFRQNIAPSHCESAVQCEYAGLQSAGQVAASSTPSSQVPLPQMQVQFSVHVPAPTLPVQPCVAALSHSSPASTAPLPHTAPASAHTAHARFAGTGVEHSQRHELLPPTGRDSRVDAAQSQPPPTAALPAGQLARTTALNVPPALTCWNPEIGPGASWT